MKVALFTNSNYSINKRNKNRTITHTPSFAGSSAKVPKEINAAFTFLRKQIEAGMQGKSQNIFAVKKKKKNDEVALVMLEKRRKNWLLSFLSDNIKEGKKAEVTHYKGDKDTIELILKNPKTKMELNKFLSENGIQLGNL